MLKPTYRDLAVILGLSIATLVFLNLPALNVYPINLIPQILILIFLPGYAVLAVIDPLFNRSRMVKKVLLTIGVSLLITIILTLISPYIHVNLVNYTFLILLTIILSIIAIFRRKMFSRRLNSLARDEDERHEDKKPVEHIKVDRTDKAVIKDEEKDIPVKHKSTVDTSTPKKRFPSLDLLLVIILTGLCALFVLEPTLNKTVVRTVLGLFLVLFLPGYALIAALFPKKDDLDTIERLALSFGLSIAITPLIGLILNYTPYGIRLDPILVSLTGVTVLLCAVAFLRRRRIPEEERFQVDFTGFFNGLKGSFKGESRTGKILSAVLILSIILAISTTAYIIVKPKEGESFTEFYILGPDGKASNYPTNLTPGQEGKVTIGIVNHENKNTSYRLVVTSNNTVQLEQTISLKDGQKMEIPFNFTAGEPGERKMEFLLYKLPDNNNIYRSLHLWINITGSSNAATG